MKSQVFVPFGDLSIGKVKITGDDSTKGYLSDKITEGDNITLEVVNPGGNETLKVSSIRKLTAVVRKALSPTEGDFVYDLDLHSPMYYNGSAWVMF